MTEQLISFETAKLAKEKGFDIWGKGMKTFFSHNVWNKWIYSFEDEFYYSEIYKSTKEIGFALDDEYPVPLYEPYYVAPTQSFLQKWIREDHGFFIGITCDSFGKFDYHGYEVDTRGKDLETLIEIGAMPYRFNSYEEALEAGLQDALKLINTYIK